MQLGLSVGLSKQRKGVIAGEIPAVGGDPPGSFDGFETPPTVETIADTVVVRGKTKAGFIGKFVVPLGDLIAGRVYNVNFVADLSGLAQGGAKSGFGFGMKNGNSFQLTLLQGDGVGVNATTVRGSPPNGWNKQTGHTTANGGAPTNGTQHAADVQLVTNAGGDAYTFSTSGDDQETWNAELEDQALTPFADVTAVEQFGIAGWFASDDAGEFTITVTWTEAAAGEWQVSFANALDNTHSDGWSGWTVKSRIPGSLQSVSGSKCRITFTPPTSGESTTFAACRVHNNGNTSDLVTVGASSTITLTAGGAVVVTDEIDISIDHTQDIWVAFGSFSAPADRINTDSSLTGATYYYANLANDTADPTNTAGFTTISNAIAIVSKIEVFA